MNYPLLIFIPSDDTQLKLQSLKTSKGITIGATYVYIKSYQSNGKTLYWGNEDFETLVRKEIIVIEK